MVNTDYTDIISRLYGTTDAAEIEKMQEIARTSNIETDAQLAALETADVEVNQTTAQNDADVKAEGSTTNAAKETEGFTEGDAKGVCAGLSLASSFADAVCKTCVVDAQMKIEDHRRKMAKDQADTKDACAVADAEIAKNTTEMKTESLEWARKAKEAEAEAHVSGARIASQRSVEDLKAAEFAKNEKASEGPDSNKKARGGLAYFGATGYFYG